MLTALILVLTSLFLLIYIARNRKQKYSLPPGPRGLPLIGNLLQIGRKPHLKLSQWALQYGKLYTVKFAHKPVLVVTDAKLMRELFGKMESAGAVTNEISEMIPGGRYGLHAVGEKRLEQRQFFTRVIRQFAFGQSSCKEDLVKKEVKGLIDWIKKEQKSEGKVYVHEKLKETTGNVVWALCSGEQFQADPDINIVKLGVSFLKDLQAIIMSGLLFCPWIKYLRPVASGYNQFKSTCSQMHKYVENTFTRRMQSISAKEEPQCFIDAYIDKVKNCQDKLSSFYGETGWKHSVSAIVLVFISGGDGMGEIMNWIIFYMSVYPQIQQKLQQEIDEVTENLRDAGLADRPKMPYTEAVILEALRFSCLIPCGITHMLTEDITFHGYNLPKGLLLQPIFYDMHFNKATWGDPENFRPERFLGNGSTLKESLMVFQPGKRTCPGQQIAMDVIFSFVVKLFQTFTFGVDHSSITNVNEYLEPVFELSLETKKLPVLAISRE